MKKLIIIVAALVALSSFAGPQKAPATIIMPGSMYFPRYALLTNQIAKLRAQIAETKVLETKANQVAMLQEKAHGNSQQRNRGAYLASFRRQITGYESQIARLQLDLMSLEESARRSVVIPK